MEFWTLTWWLLVAIVLYFVYTKVKQLYRLFREYFVLWNVAVGARSDRRSISTRARLHAYVCKTHLLDEVSISQLYSFLKSMMDSDITMAQFHLVLLSYKFVVLCRERMDGSLRGAMLLGVDHKENCGKKCTVFRIGLAFFQKFYQGGPLLYYVVAYHVLWELLFHPFTPVYITGKAFSYKSYVTMANNLNNFYPRYDAETPSFEQKLINEFASSVKSADEVFDPKRCVLERTLSAMKEFVAPILKHDLANPHIAFFQETNPGWKQGHQLIVIGQVKLSDFLSLVLKAVTKARSTRKEGIERNRFIKKRVRSRQFSFQDETAKRHARKVSDALDDDVGKEEASTSVHTQDDNPEGNNQVPKEHLPLVDIFWY